MQQRLTRLLHVLVWVYILAAHAAVAAFLLSSEFRAAVYWRLPPAGHRAAFWLNMVAAQARLDASLSPGAAVFLGDSGIQSLDASAVALRAVNYGIGGDTIAGVRLRLAHYPSLAIARMIVLLVGSNDLLERPSSAVAIDYAALLDALPAGVPLVIGAVLPIDERVSANQVGYRANREITDLNVAIEHLCATRSICRVVNVGDQLSDGTGNLRADMHVGDGLHLTAAGYRVLIEALKAVVAEH